MWKKITGSKTSSSSCRCLAKVSFLYHGITFEGKDVHGPRENDGESWECAP